jgi:hypothetical protein
MMIRIFGATNKNWRIGLYILISILAAVNIASSCFHYLQCRPLRALWDYSMPRELCVSRPNLRNWMYTASAVFFLADIILAITPIFIVKNRSWPMREKFAIVLLMGLGLLASAAIIPKFIQLQHFTTEYDITWEVAELVMWSNIEPCLGIIAISIPALRKLLVNQFGNLCDSTLGFIRLSRNISSNDPVISKTSTAGKSEILTVAFVSKTVE